METTVDEYRKKLFSAQENAVRIRHNDWTEEQIKERCQELQNQIIEAEERPRWSSHLGKIWEQKRKRV